MKVLVTKKAFYNGARREPGTSLTVPDETKGTWFQKLPEKDEPEAADTDKKAAAKGETKTASAGGQNKPSGQKAADDKQANDLV